MVGFLLPLSGGVGGKSEFEEMWVKQMKLELCGILTPLGITCYYHPEYCSLRIEYSANKKIKERLGGKIDKEIKNQEIFFSYDIHKIFNSMKQKPGVQSNSN